MARSCLHSPQFAGGRLGRLARFPWFRRASSSVFGTAKTRLTNSSNLARGTLGDPGLLPAKGVLPDQLAVGDPLSNDSGGSRNKPRGVGSFTGIEAVSRLVQ